MLAITFGHESRHIGNIKIGPIDWDNGISDLVTVIGDRTTWGKGLASRAIRIAGDLAFESLGLRKLSGAVIAGNNASLAAYTNAGWVVEGRLVGHILEGNNSLDRILISRFNPKFFSSA
jgi:RimJ/RimL family protein N-acetyltransferase